VIDLSKIRLAAFDDLDLFLSSREDTKTSKLSKTWNVWPTDQDVSMNAIDGNSCFGEQYGRQWYSRFLSFAYRNPDSRYKCLPSFIIAGFEKCGTSVLDIWLSQHPNLLTPYGETRFFRTSLQYRDQQGERLEHAWHEYLDMMPYVPAASSSNSNNNIGGSYYVYEKTPGYVNNPVNAKTISRLLPNVKLLFLTRNPVDRAYSLFNMYTQFYDMYGHLSNALRGKPVSFFVKHVASGRVRCVRDFDPVQEPDVGGRTVLIDENGEDDHLWQYLSFPADPSDFDAYVRYAVEKPVNLQDHSRSTHVLQPGLYSTYLKEWLQYFAPESFVIIPSELFFPPDRAVQSLEKLQQLLGLPVFDYGYGILKEESHRMEARGSPQTALLHQFWDFRKANPMLNETRELLNEYYCKTNRELSGLLGNRKLPGYACTG